MGEFRALCSAVGGSPAAGRRYVDHAVRLGLLMPAEKEEELPRRDVVPRFRFNLARYTVLTHGGETLSL